MRHGEGRNVTLAGVTTLSRIKTPGEPEGAAPPSFAAFREVPRTGVIYVTTEAQRRGYSSSSEDWCNLGQGMPESETLPGAPPRISELPIREGDHEYAPVAGLWELREAVADLYNTFYRREMPSRYSAENVCISGGGRAALTRVAASLGHVNLGHFLPDYTAYEELLDVFRLFSPIPILLEAERGYAFSVGGLRREIQGRGLSAILASNPCNPTGKHVRGEELAAWVRTAEELDCTLLLDEFYSHYVYGVGGPAPMESAARYVENVDTTPVVILDGLTKNWRYPGWRVTWTVGPREVIDAVASAGSFLDGGGSKPMQRAAIQLLEPATALAETEAIQQTFADKRKLLIHGARRLGMTIDREPEGTFYVWARLPDGAGDGMAYFRQALDKRVIVVPGEFFDVNPGKRRSGRPSRFRRHVRLSFGPPRDVLERAVARLERVVKR